jgi:CBS domain containing-hemolysin-like protein
MNTLLFLALALLLSISAFLAASEAAFFSLSSSTLESYERSTEGRKRLIALLLMKPRELLVTIMMIDIFCNILVQNTVSNIFGKYGSILVKVGIPLFLTLFIGEIIPKAIALPNNRAVAYKLAPIIAFFSRIIWPLRVALTKITNYVSRFFFFFLQKEKKFTEDELQTILSLSKEKHILDKDEYALTSGFLSLRDSLIKEHMQAKDDILFYDINKPLTQLLQLFVDKKQVKVPVCNGEIENLIGVISAKRFFFYQDKILSEEMLKMFVTPAFFLPDTTNGWLALQQMREKTESLALVVDEYGNICGLITDKTLIKTIIGDFVDPSIKVKKYTYCSQDVIIASGKMTLDEFEAVFKVKLPRIAQATTLGGWLMEKTQSIPQVGQKFTFNGFNFYILFAAPNRIHKIYVQKIATKKEDKK